MYMPARKKAGFRTFAVIALIAFGAGRCSVDRQPASDVASDTRLRTFSSPLLTTDIERTASPDELSGVLPLIVDDVGSEDRSSAAEPVDALEDQSDVNVYYRNCAAARAAGAAPVRSGDPGYARHLDRDNDGIGCE